MLTGCGDSTAQPGAATGRTVDLARAASSQFAGSAPEAAANDLSGAPPHSSRSNPSVQASPAAAPRPGGGEVLASRLLGSRFTLSWRPEQRSDGSVTVTVRSADGSRRLAEGASYEAEFSVRNGELGGCAVTDPSQGHAVVEAVCAMENGRLILRIGRAHDRGSSMYIELRSVGDNRYEGSVMIRTPVLPMDVRIGNATMQPLLA